MITRELLAFISSQIAAGVNADAIKRDLLNKNWQQTDIDQAMMQVSGSVQVPTASVNNPVAPPKKNSALLKIGAISACIVFGIICILFVLDKVISPTTTAITQCYTDAAVQSKATLTESMAITDKAERIKKYCTDSTPNLTSLVTCIEAAKKMNELASKIVDIAAPPAKKLDPILENHNNNCPDSIVHAPLD